MVEGRVGEFIRTQVADWDVESVATARFKAFSGQRTDWEPKYLFWKNLILKVASHLNLFIINPSEVKKSWFNRGGLTPLCLDHVLVQMYKDGEIITIEELEDPTCSQLSILFRKALKIVSRPASDESILEHPLILMPLLKEKSSDIVKILSQNQWTPSCIITKEKFQALCGGSNEALSVFSYLSKCGKAKYLSIKKTDVIEGVKVSLSQDTVPNLMSLDYDQGNVLEDKLKVSNLPVFAHLLVHRKVLVKLQKFSMTSLNGGNRKTSLRHVREMKVASHNREKCISLLNRVEEVLDIIANAESTKKVAEAIQIGTHAMKENRVSITEVENCLRELDEAVDSQNQMASVIESSGIQDDIDDEDIEEELAKLELEVLSEEVEPSTAENEKRVAEEKVDFSASLCDDISKLNISDSSTDSCSQPQLKDKGSRPYRP
ncbi:unnamed protein product [Rhodiola kirilowii]